MAQVFAAFGIDWRLLLVNTINFGVLLLALWYFLYGPLTKLLEKRRQKIAAGVRDALEASKKLAQIEKSRESVMREAGKEADAIATSARQAGVAKERELAAAGERAAAATLREAEAQAQELKRAALEESKQEVAKLIVLGIDRMMKQHAK